EPRRRPLRAGDPDARAADLDPHRRVGRLPGVEPLAAGARAYRGLPAAAGCAAPGDLARAGSDPACSARPPRKRGAVLAAPPRPAAARLRPRVGTGRATRPYARAERLLPTAELRPGRRNTPHPRGAGDLPPAGVVRAAIHRAGAREQRALHARPPRAGVGGERRLRRDRRRGPPAPGAAHDRSDAPMRVPHPRARLAAGLLVGFLLGAVVTLALQGGAQVIPRPGRPGTVRPPQGDALPKTTPEP